MSVVSCLLCKKEFNKKPSQILLCKKHYCSNTCSYAARRRGKVVNCHICGLEVYKKNKDLINSKIKKYFCGIACSNKWLGIKNRNKNHHNWINGRSVYRALLERRNNIRNCIMCGEDKFTILVAHHIDQNRENNNISNLILLCRNCHFLIHHYVEELSKFNRVIKKYV